MANGPFYEAGDYIVQIKDQGLGEAENEKKTPFFYLTFTVLGRPAAPDAMEYVDGLTQYERTYYRYLTDETIEYATQDLRSLGFNRQSLTCLDLSSPDPQSFVGMALRMRCKHEAGKEGQQREVWNLSFSKARAVKGAGNLSQQRVRELDRKFSVQLRMLSIDSAIAAKPPQQPEAVMAEDVL